LILSDITYLLVDIFQLRIITAKCLLDSVQEGPLGLGNMHLGYFDQNLTRMRGRRNDKNAAFNVIRSKCWSSQGLVLVFTYLNIFKCTTSPLGFPVPLGNASPFWMWLATRLPTEPIGSFASASLFHIVANFERQIAPLGR
jgi:hypothetical protein